MNTLWKQIEDFDLDYPLSEYGFSLRLANENNWTINFTENSILEYKKFMYLAATSELMVSPSGIVDVVWHEHLVFTQSYNKFCSLLGKKIDHIPSTHNRSEFEKFKLAKERTNKLYESTFGEQPEAYWNYSNIYEPLLLTKAKIKIRTFLLIGILSFSILFAPLYYLLKDVYIRINNPYFLYGYYGIIIISFLILQYHNRTQILLLVKKWNVNSFVFNLSPHELVFLKTGSLADVIHDSINQMVKQNKISVAPDHQLTINDNTIIQSSKELGIVEEIQRNEKIHYPDLLKILIRKPAFHNIADSLNAFKKYFSKSIVFGRLFYVSFIVLSTVFLLGLIRVTTGLSRDKPVTILVFTLLIYGIFMIVHLYQTMGLITRNIIPGFYKTELIPVINNSGSGEWNYFLFGNLALDTSFVPLVRYKESSSSSGSDSGGSSCSSGCGSSCGSSCGGCGGGD